MIRPTAIIHPTASIGPNVTIGERVYIGPGAVIGYHAESYKIDPRQPNPGKVIIEDDVTIHELVTIQSSTNPDTPTRIGHHARVQAHAHVGHDAQVGHHATISCGVKVGGHSVVGPWANVGLNAVLHQYSNIGEGTMVGASAFCKGKVEAWRKVAGVPARDIGENTIGLDRKLEREREEQERGTVIRA